MSVKETNIKVYVYDRVEDKTNILRCLDINTGIEEWAFTNEAPGSVSYDGTRAIPSSDGEKMLYLIDPTPEGFKVLAQAELLETKQAWGPLALSDGKLIIRDQKQMKCVVVK